MTEGLSPAEREHLRVLCMSEHTVVGISRKTLGRLLHDAEFTAEAEARSIAAREKLSKARSALTDFERSLERYALPPRAKACMNSLREKLGHGG